jgi:hypothetical protein
MEARMPEYWLLTVWGRPSTPQATVWKGSLADYAMRYQNEPILFCHELTQGEYENLYHNLWS